MAVILGARHLQSGWRVSLDEELKGEGRVDNLYSDTAGLQACRKRRGAVLEVHGRGKEGKNDWQLRARRSHSSRHGAN